MTENTKFTLIGILIGLIIILFLYFSLDLTLVK